MFAADFFSSHLLIKPRFVGSKLVHEFRALGVSICANASRLWNPWVAAA